MLLPTSGFSCAMNKLHLLLASEQQQRVQRSPFAHSTRHRWYARHSMRCASDAAPLLSQRRICSAALFALVAITKIEMFSHCHRLEWRTTQATGRRMGTRSAKKVDDKLTCYIGCVASDTRKEGGKALANNGHVRGPCVFVHWRST